MRDYLLTQIDDLDRAILDLNEQANEIDRQKLIAVAKREAYRDALAHLPVPTADTKKHGRLGPRSGAWKAVLKYIADQHPDSVTNERMMSYIVEKNLPMNRDSLRAQLSVYTQKGALERVSDGVYRITQEGAAELHVALPSGADSDDDEL